MTRTNTPLVEHSKSSPSKENRLHPKKKKRAVLPKEERLQRNGKGWMEGLREKCMQPLVGEYADAQLSGGKVEKLKMREILNKFHFWFPYPLADHEEPAEIKPFDAHYVAPEGSPEFEAAKGAHLQKYNKRMRASTTRPPKANATRDPKVPKGSQAEPFNILMAKLADVHKPPRGRSAQQQWQKANWTTGEMIEDIAVREWEAKRLALTMVAESSDIEDIASYPPIDFITGVVHRMFTVLPATEQALWKENAVEESCQEKEAYEARRAQPLGSGDSASRATCVRNAPEFISKLNQGIELSSSLRLTTLAAGPMARKDGEVGFLCEFPFRAQKTVSSSFRVTTSTNRASVPMSFQEWYGVERTTALMEAYKEWVETCLGAGEVEEVLGKESTGSRQSDPYNGVFGKGFTTDDILGVVDDGKHHSRSRIDSRRETSTPVGLSKKTSRRSKGKRKAEKAKSRRKAGEVVASDTSSDDEDGLRDWSGRSSSEDSVLGANESSEGEDMAEAFRKLKMKRKAMREERKRKREERSEGKPSRKSSRRKGADEGMDVDSTDVLRMDTDQTAYNMDMDLGDGLDEEILPPLPTASGTPTAPLPAPPPLESTPSTAPTTPLPRPSGLPSEGTTADQDETVPAASPPAPNADDIAARELIVGSFLETRAGLEKGLIHVAVGLGGLEGFLSCVGRGLEFLLLPVNEFLQAAGGDSLRTIMESLIAIEMCLLNGRVDDGSGRRKAVIPVATRPPIVSAWLLNGRCRVGKSGSSMPRLVIKAGELDTFVNAWERWWAAIQPAWRVRKDGANGWKRDTYSDDWHSLIVPGQNGLLSVVAALSWWGSAVVSNEEGRPIWREALNDVEWMMVGLLEQVGKVRA